MDIETLGLAVDSRPVVKAANDLDRMAAAGKNAENTTVKAVNSINQTLAQSGAAANTAANSHVDAYRRQTLAADRHLQALRDEAAMYGKNRAQIEAYRAAQAGLTAEQQRQAASLGAAVDAARAQERQLGLLGSAATASAAAFSGLFAVKQVHDFTRALFDASAQAQRIQTTLNFASGGNGAKEYDYVRKVAKELGLELTATAEAYGKFAAASRGTALEGEGARKVFESVAKASAVMGLSADNTSGVLLALQQMISKGTVQSEELRGQLGERLPGAFHTAANAMGVTTAELGKMLEQGLVPASEFLPKFAAQLEKELGDNAAKAVNRLDASVNKFNTSWGELKRSLGDAGAAQAYAGTLDRASSGLDTLWQSIDRMAKSKSFDEWFYSAIDTSARFEERIKEARGELAAANAQLAKAPSNIYFRQAAADAQAYVDKLEAVKRAQSGAGMANPNMNAGVEASGRAREAYENTRRQEQAERDAYYAKDARQTKAQMREENITKAILTNAALVKKANGDAVELEKLRIALETEVANIVEKTTEKKTGAAAVERDSINATIEAYKREQAVVEEVSRRKVAALAAQRSAGDISEVEYIQAVAAEELKRMDAAERALQSEIRAAEARKNGRSQLAALEGQLDLQREKRITRQQELQNDLLALENARLESSRNLQNAENSRVSQELSRLADANRLTKEEIELIGLTDMQKRRLIDTRMANTIAMQQERIETMKLWSDGSQETIAAIDAEIAKLEELRKARNLNTQRNVREDAAKTTQFYRDAWMSVESSAREAWLSIGEEGVNSAERVGKALKTAVLDLLWQMTAKRWFIDIAANINGGSASAAGGLMGGGAGSLTNLVSMGRNVISALNGGFATLANDIAVYAQQGINWVTGQTATAASLPGSAAQAIGGFGSAVAGIGAGVMGGRLVSGGYSAIGGSSGNTAVNVGTAIGTIWGPLGSAIGGLIGGAVNRLFGRKLKDSGIEGEFGGERGFEGQQFEYYKGGLFRSNKTKYSPIDEDLRTALADQFVALREGTRSMAETLGLGTDSIDKFTASIKVSLKGLTAEEAQKKLAEEFDKIAESMASTVLGTEKYIWVGETAAESLVRLSTALLAVNNTFDALGNTLYESSLAGADMASSLVTLFGGVEAFTAATGSYYQNFYSEEERRAKVIEQLTKQFKDQNLVLPTTREEYRKIVSSLDLTTEEGRKTYATLIGLSEAFASAVDNGEKLKASIAAREQLEDRLLRLQGKSSELLARERQRERDAIVKLYPELGALIDEIYRLEDAANARNAAYKTLQDAVTREQELLNAQADALKTRRSVLQDSLRVITGVFDLVASNARSLYGEVEKTATVQAARGWAFIENALSVANATGHLPEQQALSQAITAARGGMVDTNYSTQFDFDRDRLVLAGQLSELEKVAGKQKTTAEMQLETLDAQLEELDQQNRYWDDQLRYWQRQIDIANGTFDATTSVADAIKSLAADLGLGTQTPDKKPSGGAVFGGSSGASGSTAPPKSKYQQVVSLGTAGVGYQNITDESLIARLDRLSPVFHAFDNTGDLAGLRAAMIAAGGTIADLSALSGYFASDWVKTFASAGLPAFATGTNYVPHDMVAMIHEGEAVVPKQYNPAAGGASETETATTLWIETVRDELRRFFGEQLRLELRSLRVLEDFQMNGVPVYERTA